LEILHDFPANEPVGENHATVHGFHDAAACGIEDGGDTIE
jgi:hypothetical protein